MGKARFGGSVPDVTRVLPRTGWGRPAKRYDSSRCVHYASPIMVVTARFRGVYGFVVMELGSRRLVHINVTGHPTAAWSLQQLREVLAMPHPYRFVLHDRDSIHAPWLDAAVAAMGVRVHRAPVHAPTANACCERLLGSLRRECLDYPIPLGEDQLWKILRVWRLDYNRGRPHAVSVLACRRHRLDCPRPSSSTIISQGTCGAWRGRSSADSTMSTDLRSWRRETARVIAEHNYLKPLTFVVP